jgi:hypothetical protein
MPVLGSATPSRLLVVWRDYEQNAGLHDVGVLAHDGEYTFRYLPGSEVAGFVPFSNFPEAARTYSARRLFPFFASRVMDRDRPDFSRLCTALDLPEDASDLALLDRTGGTRKGDRVAVVGEPVVDANGDTDHVMVARGVRFILQDAALRNEVFAQLRSGDPLLVVEDSENPVNVDALLIRTLGGTDVGWIPDRLVPYVATVLSNSGSLTVHRVNGEDQPPHLRLLVRIMGRHPADSPTLPALGLSVRRSVAAAP